MAIISGGDGDDNSDRLGKEGVNLVGEVDIDVVRSLYRRGLIYLDVPVYPDDHFQGASLTPPPDRACPIHAFRFFCLIYTTFLSSIVYVYSTRGQFI